MFFGHFWCQVGCHQFVAWGGVVLLLLLLCMWGHVAVFVWGELLLLFLCGVGGCC